MMVLRTSVTSPIARHSVHTIAAAGSRLLSCNGLITLLMLALAPAASYTMAAGCDP